MESSKVVLGGGGYTCSVCGNYVSGSKLCPHPGKLIPEAKELIDTPYPPNLSVLKYDRTSPFKLEAGKYLVVRKGGKTHFEKHNGTGWVRNEKTIEFYYLPAISQ